MRTKITLIIFAAISLTGTLCADIYLNPADINNDHRVEIDDFSALAAAWLTSPPDPNYNPACDMADPADSDVNELDAAVLAANWLWTAQEPNDMVWVYINDPGVDDEPEGNPDGIPDHEGFTGYMSKYETTNAQYCRFLNAALASGDIIVGVDNVIYGAGGSNGGADFVDDIYFRTDVTEMQSQITYNNGHFTVRIRGGRDMSSHPVVMVSWYGAAAFCNYYGYRLPTEWQWQAVADYDGNYNYGCGITIDRGKANYYDNGYTNPVGLPGAPFTNPVDHYPSYGYGLNDMAGNVMEWTNCVDDCTPGFHILRGGGWASTDSNCLVSSQPSNYVSVTSNFMGFRVIR